MTLLHHDLTEVINYLRASPLEVALIVNFGPKREHRRRILPNDRKATAPTGARTRQ